MKRSHMVAIAILIAVPLFFVLPEEPEPTECIVESHSARSAADNLINVVGLSNCKSGTVIVTLEGIPFEVEVRNHTFGVEVEIDKDQPIAIREMRD